MRVLLDECVDEKRSMKFTMVGFRDLESVRTFTFEFMRTDRTRGNVIVDANLSAARRHRIMLQELPLLCRRLLDKLDTDEVPPTHVSFSESNMVEHAAAISAQASLRKAPKPHKTA
jgi:hypothetical protein